MCGCYLTSEASLDGSMQPQVVNRACNCGAHGPNSLAWNLDTAADRVRLEFWGKPIMKPRENLLRLKRFEADEKARKVADLEAMIREFELMASDLDRQIESEESRTGIKDARHFAYSTFAKAAAQRRDNLVNSVEDLRAKLEAAMNELDAARENLNKAEVSDPREPGFGRRRGEPGNDARFG